MKKDIYKAVTDQILTALDAGVVPWQLPWVKRADIPRNLLTKKEYSGTNIMMLALTQFRKGYATSAWGTFKQIQVAGGKVRKGEKSPAFVIFWQVKDRECKETGKVTSVPFLRRSAVFNLEQADWPDGEPDVGQNLPAFEHSALHRCELAVDRWEGKPKIRHGFNQAVYRIKTDSVEMPDLSAFHSVEGYYSTLFHELVHSTGAASRLGRAEVCQRSSLDDEAYAREELVAEFGAAFICAALGVEPDANSSPAYIAHWRQYLTAHPQAVVQAAGRAQAAADLILKG